MTLWSRIRRALGGAVLWAGVWGLAGILMSPQLRRLAHAPELRSILDRLFDGVWVGWYGFVAGLLFAIMLAVVGRRRSVAELSLIRSVAAALLTAAIFTALPYAFLLPGRVDGWRREDGLYVIAAFGLTLACALGSALFARQLSRRTASATNIGARAA